MHIVLIEQNKYILHVKNVELQLAAISIECRRHRFLLAAEKLLAALGFALKEDFELKTLSLEIVSTKDHAVNIDE